MCIRDSTKTVRTDVEQTELVQMLTRVHTHLLLEKSGPAPIVLHNHQNTQYVGELEVGTPGQNIMCIFDTGSGTFWVPSKVCKAAGCHERPPFDNAKSSTFTEDPDKDNFAIKYGSGDVRGKVVIDDIEIGGLKLAQARIGVVTKEHGGAFEHAAFSGLVGMAYPSLARAGMTPVFDQLMQNKLMKRNRFTFFMSDDAAKGKSGIWFDDVPKSLFKGALHKHPVVSQRYWSVKLLDIKVGTKSTGVCKDGCNAAIDSGTSLLTAPTEIATAVLRELHKDPSTCRKISTAPTLTYVIEAELASGEKTRVEYPLEPKEYMLQDSLFNKDCGRAALNALDVPKPNGPVVILGDIFMSKYMSVFDRDANAVYIAEANQASDKAVLFSSEPTDALLEADLVRSDDWTEISSVVGRAVTHVSEDEDSFDELSDI
eukprot:TRINITY_DN416_c0_g1_i5.p1 TRINITY_DN416_c0_g1~~TRINITY_DN416_c0_g1_i5.p1  ORF type:complete len:428 (+),score=140.39 TRINITY_DN416_c0_g1_i5:120-1403(+)